MKKIIPRITKAGTMVKMTKFSFMVLTLTFLQTLIFSPAQAQTATWTTCAPEDGICLFSGTREVRYGAGTTWVTKTFTSSTSCSNAVFGDPLKSVAKTCQVSSIDLTSAPTPTPSITWTRCATENSTCSFTGTREVRYGAGTKWYTKTFTGSTACTNAVFGDPIQSTLKSCEYSSVVLDAPTPTPTPTPEPSITWTTCAQENGICSFTGTREVKYGAGTKWVTKTFTTSTPCTNAVFGDPIQSTIKSCQYSSVVIAAPTPTPTPAPAPTPAPDDGRRVLKVCASGCAYTLPSQAIAASLANDIIEVAAGTYSDCFSVTRNNIKLRGTGGRAHLSGKMCDGKGAIVTSASDTVIENFEFSNMYVADRNGAGIRHQGLGLIVRNSHFHDGENGILSGRGDATPNPLDIITIENSRFEHLGGNGGQAHGVYFGASSQVTVSKSIFLASKEDGHEFKSRAKNTSIDCSYIGGTDGQDSYTLNFPDGGLVSVKNSVVEQGPFGGNNNIIDYGSEMLNRHPVNTFNLNNVTVMNDLDRGTFFNVRNSTQFAITGALIVGPGNMYSLQTAAESGIVKQASRAAAGIGAYPSFPKPVACTGTIGLTN
jgi:hypothetical protein